MVQLVTSATWARMSCWAMEPANSKLLLVISPRGLQNEERRSQTHCGNRCRHKIGSMLVSPALEDKGIRCTPHMPTPAASNAPSVRGSASGINSAICVGREVKSRTSHQKSSKKPWRVEERRRRLQPVSLCQNFSWRTENKPAHPGRAIDIDQSSPTILCQVFVAIQRWLGVTEGRISCNRWAQYSSKEIVLVMVSRNQPRMTFIVDHRVSLFLHFLRETSSCQKGVSLASKGQKILSRAWKRIRLTVWRCHLFPWLNAQKLLT